MVRRFVSLRSLNDRGPVPRFVSLRSLNVRGPVPVVERGAQRRDETAFPPLHDRKVF